MKLLKTDDNRGHFLKPGEGFSPIDQITKEDLLRLVDLVLMEDEVEFDPYSDDVIQNEAHRILYKNILEKLEELRGRREDFLEQRDGLYREAYEQYRQDLSQPDGEDDGETKKGKKPRRAEMKEPKRRH